MTSALIRLCGCICIWHKTSFLMTWLIYEPRHEKTCFSHMRTTKAQNRLRRSLISTFAVRCLDTIIPLVSVPEILRLQQVCRLVWVYPSLIPRRQVFSRWGSYILYPKLQDCSWAGLFWVLRHQRQVVSCCSSYIVSVFQDRAHNSNQGADDFVPSLISNSTKNNTNTVSCYLDVLFLTYCFRSMGPLVCQCHSGFHPHWCADHLYTNHWLPVLKAT